MNGPRAARRERDGRVRERARAHRLVDVQRATRRDSVLRTTLPRFVRERTDLAVMAMPGTGRQGYRRAL